jgi:hypothetical protein
VKVRISSLCGMMNLSSTPPTFMPEEQAHAPDVIPEEQAGAVEGDEPCDSVQHGFDAGGCMV